jgi:hypothetical protein
MYYEDSRTTDAEIHNRVGADATSARANEKRNGHTRVFIMRRKTQELKF